MTLPQDSVSDVERACERSWNATHRTQWAHTDADMRATWEIAIRAVLSGPIIEIGEDAGEVDGLRKIVCHTLWMACRYAHGRQSYAMAMYNVAARDVEALGVLPKVQEPHFTIDGLNSPEMSRLTQTEFDQAWRGWHGDDAIPNHCRRTGDAPHDPRHPPSFH